VLLSPTKKKEEEVIDLQTCYIQFIYGWKTNVSVRLRNGILITPKRYF